MNNAVDGFQAHLGACLRIDLMALGLLPRGQAMKRSFTLLRLHKGSNRNLRGHCTLIIDRIIKD